MHPLPQTYELENPPTEFIDECGGLLFRSIVLPEIGMVVPQHRHAVDHVTIVASGAARLWINSKWVRDIAAFGVIEVKAGNEHVFQALVRDTRLSCVFIAGKVEGD